MSVLSCLLISSGYKLCIPAVLHPLNCGGGGHTLTQLARVCVFVCLCFKVAHESMIIQTANELLTVAIASFLGLVAQAYIALLIQM